MCSDKRKSKLRSSSAPSSDQVALPGLDFRKQLSFGGSLLKRSHAKTSRPLSSKQALHVVLRSDWATGSRSFLKSERVIQNTLKSVARKHGVKIYRVANAGNHLHLLLKFTQRRGLQNFLRGACGIIARKILGAERGRAKKWSTYLAPEQSFIKPRPKGPRTGGKDSSTPTLPTGLSPNARPIIPVGESFWTQRPFTRIVSFGRDYNSVLGYLRLNTLEALGFLSRRFTRELPSQEIRGRVLYEISMALGYG